ncbi:MAG TPA: DUF503 domain-containing protein [Gaiellaceae bacterium]|nr:DUF503 domain-containing protein [Gaiellaceae bacterium]
MGSGFVTILTVELHFPEAASLKGKRQFVRSAKDNLRNRFGASVAEVDHHDLWQRATLTVACVARSAHDAQELADGAVRWLGAQEWELTRADRLLISPED